MPFALPPCRVAARRLSFRPLPPCRGAARRLSFCLRGAARCRSPFRLAEGPRDACPFAPPFAPVRPSALPRGRATPVLSPLSPVLSPGSGRMSAGNVSPALARV